MGSILFVKYVQHLCYTSSNIKMRKPYIELYCFAWLKQLHLWSKKYPISDLYFKL